jgi:membrane protein required for beta-lactamase induction
VTTPVDDGPRRVPRTIGGVVYLLVVAMTLVGLGITVAGAWRTGVGWMGAALLLGALARAVLSERGAGMLRVRRRWSDVVTLTLVGVALIVLAVVVPEQPL